MTQRAFQVSLRDWLWLLLLTAIGVGWHLERQSAAALLSKTTKTIRFRRSAPYAGEPQAERLALAAKVRGLNDAPLAEGFRNSFDCRFDYGDRKAQVYMSELARRGLLDEMEKEYEAFRAQPGRARMFPDPRVLLTALAWARGEPDPVTLTVELPATKKGKRSLPQLEAALQVSSPDGRYYPPILRASEKDERWQVLLTAPDGQRVPFSEVRDWEYSAPSQNTLLDVRRYLQPPKSGRYQMQVIFNAHNAIAKSSDLTGLIVWKSEPIWVEVENDLDQRQISALPVLVVLAFISLGWLAWHLRKPDRSTGPSPAIHRWTWRHWLPPTLITAALLGWLLHLQHLRQEIDRVMPDSEASWTMRLAKGTTRKD